MPGKFQFETSLSYQPAGVRFNVSLATPASGGDAAFKLGVDDLATGQRVRLAHQACPAVHDFTRGYTRWLGTKGIRATRGEYEITGTARADFNSAQLLQLAHDVVDMIDQKFPNYKEPVIGPKATRLSDVVYEKRDGVAYLLINRPEVYNAKRGITMNQMAEVLLDAGEDQSVRVVVISGAGSNAFCTGNDQSYDPDVENAEYAGTHPIGYSRAVREIPQPVICAVDGFAIGSGNILCYESDFTIATAKSRFGQTGPRVGSPAAGHGTAVLAGRVGQKRAREIWMVCRQYTAPEAYEMGLINKVVANREELWKEVDRWIADIKNVSPVIVQMQKISFNQYDDHIKPEVGPVQQHIPGYLASEECKERRVAFIERRPIDPAKNMPYVKIPIKASR
ncbi:MAG: enoyl-CoA hydratase/isomerase family protein [Chloroflexi bacterium]|nr:enoyl-CoA hydratase/isomerase family protein [Chloroflexota bacterium]